MVTDVEIVEAKDALLTVTLTGEPTAVIQALVKGCPVPALVALYDALTQALADRKG